MTNYYSEIKFTYYTGITLNIDWDLIRRVKHRPFICILISVTTITHLSRYWRLIQISTDLKIMMDKTAATGSQKIHLTYEN